MDGRGVVGALIPVTVTAAVAAAAPIAIGTTFAAAAAEALLAAETKGMSANLRKRSSAISPAVARMALQEAQQSVRAKGMAEHSSRFASAHELGIGASPSSAHG